MQNGPFSGAVVVETIRNGFTHNHIGLQGCGMRILRMRELSYWTLA